MATARKHRGGGGTKKFGRDEMKCQVYRSENKREKSRIKKIKKHISNNPKDNQAKASLRKFQDLLAQAS